MLELDRLEAEAFRYIARHGSTTGPALAAWLGKSRATAYELLRSLVDKGVVVEEPGRPLRYHARPLAEAVAAKQSELEARLEALRAAAVPRAHRRPSPSYILRPGSVALFHGSRAAARESLRLAASADSFALAVGRDCFGATPALWRPILVALEEKAEQGAHVRVYLDEEDAAGPLAKEVAARLGRDRLVITPTTRSAPVGCMCVDRGALLLFPTSEEAGELDVLGLRVLGSAMSDFTREAIASMLRPRLAEPMAPPGSWEGLREFLDVIRHAETSVFTVAGPGFRGLFPEEQVAEINARLGEAAERGVQVRTVVDAGLADLALLQRIPAPPGVHVRIGRWIPCWTTIIDERLLYQGYTRGTEGIAGRRSVDPSELKMQLHLFEHAWEHAQPAQEVLGGEAARRRPPAARAHASPGTAKAESSADEQAVP